MKITSTMLLQNRKPFYTMLALLLVLSACSSKPEVSTTEQVKPASEVEESLHLTSQQFKSSNFTLGNLEMASFHEGVKASGLLSVPPEGHATVSCYFGGTVKNIPLLPGQRVKKGQLLFTLENPDYVQLQQEFLEAKSQLSYLKTDYERQKNLVQDNVTSQKNFLLAEAEYTSTMVKVKSLGKKLNLLGIDPNSLTLENIRTTVPILSPINGYVTEVAVSQGAFLSPAQTAVTIIDIARLHVELQIFEKDLAAVRIGQEIRFKIQDDPSKEYRATVRLINKMVDAEKRTVSIHGDISGEVPAGIFSSGMYVEATIFTSAKSVWSLPEDAVVQIDDKYYALALQEMSDTAYSFQKVEIQAGISSQGQIEILNHESFGKNTKFLTAGAFNILNE
jgi:membrane fusion protein, heavy metal efflux system